MKWSWWLHVVFLYECWWSLKPQVASLYESSQTVPSAMGMGNSEAGTPFLVPINMSARFPPPLFLLKFFLSTIDTPKTDCLHVMWIKMYSKAVRAWNVSLTKDCKAIFLQIDAQALFWQVLRRGVRDKSHQEVSCFFLLFSSLSLSWGDPVQLTGH